jgi:hypothetical protein
MASHKRKHEPSSEVLDDEFPPAWNTPPPSPPPAWDTPPPTPPPAWDPPSPPPTWLDEPLATAAEISDVPPFPRLPRPSGEMLVFMLQFLDQQATREFLRMRNRAPAGPQSFS